MSCVSHYCGTVVLFHSMHLKGLNTETEFLFSIIRSAQWGFLGFGVFFPSKYCVVFIKIWRGWKTFFFFIHKQMVGIRTSSMYICIDVSRIYSSIINLSILGHPISVQNFFLALSSSVRNTTDPSRNETFCLLCHLQLPPAGLNNTALAQLYFPQPLFKWFMFYVKVSGFHWIQWATL